MRSAGFSTPALEVGDARHVIGIQALRDDPAGEPLGEVAQRASRQRGHSLEESLLHPDVQVEGQIDGPADQVGTFFHTQVGLRGSDQFKDEIQGIDEDEVADAPFAAAGRDENLQLPQILLPPGMLGVETEPIELGPVGQQWRDHGRDPTVGRIRHEPHLASQKTAVKSLVEFAQVRGRQGVVCDGQALLEQVVPEARALIRIGIGAFAGRMSLGEAGQGGARHGHGGEDPIFGRAGVQGTQPGQHLFEVSLVGQVHVLDSLMSEGRTVWTLLTINLATPKDKAMHVLLVPRQSLGTRSVGITCPRCYSFG